LNARHALIGERRIVARPAIPLPHDEPGGPLRATVDDPEADEAWMRLALEEAQAALGHQDVPVGCVVVGPTGEVLARGRNRREESADPTAHAELVAMRAAAAALGRWRLDGCTLVVTLEPCAMCAGAIAQARVARLVFGADDPKAGAVASLWDLVRDPRLPHRVEVRRGVLAQDCAQVLRTFFRARRPQR